MILVTLAATFLPLTGEAQQACRTIANGVRAAQLGDTSYRPALVLDSLPDAVIHFDRGRLLEPAQAVTVLRDEFRASAELQARVTRMGKMIRAVGLYRFGNSTLYVKKLFIPSPSFTNLGEGELLDFFEAPAGGTADIVDELPILGSRAVAFGEGPARAIVRVGEIDGVPALMIESGRDEDAEISVTPWKDGAWQPECKIAIHFDVAINVSEQFCKSANCEDFSAAALILVDQFRTGKPFPFNDKNSKAILRALDKELLESPQTVPPTPLPFETFDHPSVHDRAVFHWNEMRSIDIGGQTYFGRVGPAEWPWDPDLLVVLYRPLPDDKLDPVASVYVSKTRRKASEVTVK